MVINEIGWMGTATSSSDEWLELYNGGVSSADLTGWRVRADDGKPDIILSGTIAAGGYYLIERTNDTAIRDIPADLVASFSTGLSNAGEGLALLDTSGSVRDRVDCAGGWYAGDNTEKASMERKDSLKPGNDSSNWVNNNGIVTTGTDAAGNPIHGTPKYRNSVAL